MGYKNYISLQHINSFSCCYITEKSDAINRTAKLTQAIVLFQNSHHSSSGASKDPNHGKYWIITVWKYYEIDIKLSI